jgi:hypothetical protein
MTTISVVRPDAKRKWYGLALRHLRMASRLLISGFADGATFHAYHAYECVLSSFIAGCGYPVPPEGWTKLISPKKTIWAYPSPRGGIPDRSAHKARLAFFNELADSTKPYFLLLATLRRYLTLDVRMDSLYYDANLDRLPHNAYSHPFALGLIPEVHLFAQEVWKEIR